MTDSLLTFNPGQPFIFGATVPHAGLVSLAQVGSPDVMSKPGSLIALVDDDPDVLRALGRLLRSYGFVVKSFHCGAACLDWMDQNKPDGVILDVQMPEMSGFELQAEIARRDPLLRVIFITADSSHETHETARRLGVTLLLKPFQSSAILGALGCDVVS